MIQSIFGCQGCASSLSRVSQRLILGGQSQTKPGSNKQMPGNVTTHFKFHGSCSTAMFWCDLPQNTSKYHCKYYIIYIITYNIYILPFKPREHRCQSTTAPSYCTKLLLPAPASPHLLNIPERATICSWETPRKYKNVIHHRSTKFI